MALSGFEYQRAFAVWRLAALVLRLPLAGGTQIPVLMRYEWAEDIDELSADGTVVLWQCKHGDSWHTPAPLADVLLGFAPKWLWTPSEDRSRLRFRLVTSDPFFAAFHDQPGLLPERDKVEKAFVDKLAEPPGERSDRAVWQNAAEEVGHQALFDALYGAASVLYVPGVQARDARHWTAELRAVDELARGSKVADASQSSQIIDALRPLLDIQPNTALDAQGQIARSNLPPRWFYPHEVQGRLVRFSVNPVLAGLRTMDRVELQQILAQPPGPAYVARKPEWRDVVRGADPDVLFFERSRTTELETQVSLALNECRRRDGGLRMLPVLGAPGAGKSTLALRVAAMLVMAKKCIAVDLRYDLDAGDDTGPLLAALQALGDHSLPLLLLLDDPLRPGSDWPRLLDRLGRLHPAAVVLAASPDFLWNRHHGELKSTIQRLPALKLEQADAAERQALAKLYPSASALGLLQSHEELLVLAMEAAAGTSFDTIIDRLWGNLAGRQDLASALGRELPWPVAAFALVCWFSLAYVSCPAPLLHAFLADRHDVGEDAQERLRAMEQEQGWSIFQFREFEGRHNFSYLGGSVLAMHAKVAQRAWQRRPAQAWDVTADMARASVSAPKSVRNLGLALVGVFQRDAAEGERVAKQVYAAWTSEEAKAKLQTRHLCELAATLMVGGVPLSMVLHDELFRRAALQAPDSWLAAQQLYFLLGKSEDKSCFPSGLAMGRIVDAADFSLAPKRAHKFRDALAYDAVLFARFTRQLWNAFDGLLSWQLDTSLLTWLIGQRDPAEIIPRRDGIRMWLKDNPTDVSVRAVFLNLQMHRAGLLQPVDVNEGLVWIGKHRDDTDVRASLIAVLVECEDARLSSVLTRTLEHVRPGTRFFLLGAAAVRAAAALPRGDDELTRRWLDWSSDTLLAYMGNHSAQAIEQSARRASDRIATRLAGEAVKDDVAHALEASLKRLEKSLKDWSASLP